ncbi:P-loop containing nucleoside triphosphate hydrolase protein [Apiospora saccharicola]|uniref:P-loop containing nucleoside triphosphate hydrolase protein n=1 Tax=Apiospora saccharicola TaxID=335842 RepID=A0ABR1U5P5_9PEZI
MAPGIVEDEVPNGTTEVAHRPKEDKTLEPSEKTPSATDTTTNGHVHSEEQHQRCCCCCQLRSKEAVKDKTEDKKETSKDSKAKEQKKDEKDKKDKDGDEKESKEPQDETMKCEIKHLDRKYDDKDEAFFAERKDDIEKPEQKDWWRLFAFCIVRHFDSDGDLDDTRLYVNPLPLRQLIYDVIGNYPCEPIDVEDVQISAPYHCLFHYRKELETEGLSRFKDDEESLKQLTMLVDWIKKHFELEITAYERCVTNQVKAIAFDRLWTLFRPGTLVHAKMLNSPRAFRVWDHWDDDDYGEDEAAGLVLRVEYIDYDGEELGTRSMELFLPKYTGTRELSELSTMPLDLMEDAAEERELLLKRGKLMEGYTGQHFLQYNGVGLKRESCGIQRLHVNSRVMIDCKTFHEERPNHAFTVKELPPADEETAARRAEQRALRRHAADITLKREKEEKELRPLSDEEAIIATSLVRGYAFSNKEFLEFFVEDLSEIKWNTKCFDELVLDAGTKRTVQALVSMHSTRQSSFDDIVKGKGQGLVCVLHGPPGVGKTLTAECVAEFVQRPLYMVSSGDLGIDASNLDRSLARIMRMTSTWRAVLLIDEADVFLEERSPQNLHRNAMVSVFLRLLEYFAGILFLTTNRVASFDEAFKSRIHIPIRYTNLSQDSRLQIWRNFLARVPRSEFEAKASEDDAANTNGERKALVSEKDLAELAEHDLNGRQIKNVIKAAESLAAFEGKPLNMEQLREVTKIQARFEADLSNLSGIDYTAPGSTRKDAEQRHMFL